MAYTLVLALSRSLSLSGPLFPHLCNGGQGAGPVPKWKQHWDVALSSASQVVTSILIPRKSVPGLPGNRIPKLQEECVRDHNGSMPVLAIQQCLERAFFPSAFPTIHQAGWFPASPPAFLDKTPTCSPNQGGLSFQEPRVRDGHYSAISTHPPRPQTTKS